jgi:hypothetical protein
LRCRRPGDDAAAARPDETVAKLSRKSELAAAFAYMRGCRTACGRCFDDGRLALDNNPAERALRGVGISGEELHRTAPKKHRQRADTNCQSATPSRWDR